jgi:phage tail sheath protein FI
LVYGLELFPWQPSKEDELMSAFTYPGVYIEELSSGVHTITGVATSIAAFVGWAPQGPVTEATLVESWSEYETIFGGLDPRSKLGYAVNQFFANGGQQAYIVRLIWGQAGGPPPAPGTNPAPAETAIAAAVGYAGTQITATANSIASPSVTLYVGAPVLQSISITPGNLPPIPLNATGLKFTATGINSDSSQTALTSSATWGSSAPSVISVAGGGVASIIGAGTAIVTATDPTGLISGSVTVTVSNATLSAANLTISPAPVSLALGQTQQFSATGTYSDGTTHDLTAVGAWAPTADFSTTSPGLFIGTASASVTAAWLGITSATASAVTVGAKVVVSLVVTPANPVLQTTPAQTVTFTAVPVYSDGSTTPAVAVIWNMANPSVATLAGDVATAAGAGSTTITATGGSLSASTTITVTTATLNSISVTPASATIANGQSQQLKATGVYSDGTTADLTGCAAWASSGAESADVSVASQSVTVTNGVVTFANGVVTGKTPTAVSTPVPVNASWQAAPSGTSQVTVTPPVLLSMAITTPSTSTATILSGQTLQFKATGTFSDGTTQSPVTGATWNSSAPAVATINGTGLASAVASGGSMTLFANNPGAWGNNLRVTVTVPNPNPNNRFNLLVQEVDPTTGATSTLESFANLSVSPTDPQYVVTVIDYDSNYISFLPPGSTTPLLPAGPPSPTAGAIALSGGADGAVLTPATDQNFELVLLAAKGVSLLSRVDIFNLLCVPAETDAATIQKLQAFCVTERAFYIVDAPQTVTHDTLQASGPTGTPLGSGTSITGTGSQNSAYYFPWVLAPDPMFGNRPTLFPPCGFMAGMYATTDADSGVWKAPAGINTALVGVNGLQYVLTDIENGDLNPQAINCLRQFKVYGDVIWGARTLQGNDQAGSEWKYIPIRRLALFMESSLYDGTQWVVFEPNDEKLWGQIRMNVSTFMQGLFLQGAFQGTSPQQAYFVKCDSENNPQSSIDLGIVNITVGFAPLYPAEFVVIQIVQMAGQTS